MICKTCRKDIPRVKSDRVKGRASFVYVDDRSRRWNGRECPKCTSNRIVASREKDNFHGNPITKRQCRKCSKPLPSSCYFWHIECRTQDSEVYGAEDWGYGTPGTSEHTGFKISELKFLGGTCSANQKRG